MRLVMTLGLYLSYIRTFCDYLLTGHVDPMPTNPAGLLAQAAQLDKVLARPDGVFLCALFALACYGVVKLAEEVVDQVWATLVHGRTHVDYEIRGVRANFHNLKSATPQEAAAEDATAPGQSASILIFGRGKPEPKS